MFRLVLIASLVLATGCKRAPVDKNYHGQADLNWITSYVPQCPKDKVFENLKSPLKIAHRGHEQDFPENTVIALTEAAKAGVDLVEFDVQVTKDQQLVLMHDETVARTTNIEDSGGKHKMRVADLDFETLKTLDAGSWKKSEFAKERIP